MKDSKALKAAHILRKYCLKRECGKCIFYDAALVSQKCLLRKGWCIAEADLDKADEMVYEQPKTRKEE